MMDKFVFFTDSHFRSKKPVARTDDFVESLFEKLKWVLDFCKKKKVKNLLHGGDLFDSPNCSNNVAGRVAAMLAASGMNVYYILGNHDIIGKNENSYINSKLYLFESYDWFHILRNDPIRFSNTLLFGVNYSPDTEVPKEINVGRPKYILEDQCVILMLHGMITGSNEILVHEHYKTIHHTNFKTNADIVLTGHYHPGYKIAGSKITPTFANPGSFARLSKYDTEKGVGPGIIYLKVKNKTDFTMKHYKIPCDENVFDVSHLAVKINSKHEREKFVAALKELSAADLSKKNIFKALKAIKKNMPVDISADLKLKGVINLCREKLEEISNESER